ncbi:hypothetical protein [Aureimonas flava]|uniref:hypothetical protein n=1 Tax=Aureimonas flava TaxID=2320271 RepID=UPI00145A0263|nr:hypothetical protein [Aureimonas flava]
MTHITLHLPLALAGVWLVAFGFMIASPMGILCVALGVVVGAPALLFFIAGVLA